MKRLRWLLVLLATFILAMGGIAAWAHAHGRYPYPVEYRQAAVTFSHPGAPPATPLRIQEWFDVRHRSDRVRVVGAGYRNDLVLGAGRYYDAEHPQGVRASASMAGSLWTYQHGCGANDGVLPPIPGRATGAITQLPIGDSTATFRCLDARRLAPGALPAGFFDPPGSRQSLLSRLAGWVADQLARRP